MGHGRDGGIAPNAGRTERRRFRSGVRRPAGIAGVDGGRSAGDVQAQYASFDAFLLAIERWAQAKEGLYGIEEIDAYAVAANVWSKGTVLYREGGGTEILFDLLQPAVDDIDRQLSEQLDRSVFTMLNETISDYA